MAIEFICPTCGKTLKLRDEAAGKRGRCPFCKGVVTVPSADSEEDELVEIIPPTAPKTEQRPPAPPPPAEARTTPPPLPTTPTGEQTSATERICPGCKSSLNDKAVICISCGLNLKTGKKLQTVFEKPEPAPEPEKTPETDKTDQTQSEPS